MNGFNGKRRSRFDLFAFLIFQGFFFFLLGSCDILSGVDEGVVVLKIICTKNDRKTDNAYCNT